MSDPGVGEQRFRDVRLTLFVALGALVIAVASALHYAGSWNDGSRLAAVESLVDHRTWVIDDSIFVEVPQQAGVAAPYPRSQPGLMHAGWSHEITRTGFVT